MKKAIIIYCLILVGVYFLFSVLDTKSEYMAEKDLWYINKKFAEVTKDPQMTPDESYKDLHKSFSRYDRKYAHSKLRPVAQMLAARVYMFQKDYAKSREILEEIIVQSAGDQNIGPLALSEIGGSYHLEEDWDNVVKTYNRVVDDYPVSDLGLKTPILIGGFYADRNEIEQSRRAFDQAISHYQKLRKKHKGTRVDFDATRGIAISYMALKKWPEAINIWGQCLLDFPEKEYWNVNRFNRVLRAINTASVVNLKDYDSAIDVYQAFVDKYPGHVFNKTFQSIIVSLQELKEKSITVNTE